MAPSAQPNEPPNLPRIADGYRVLDRLGSGAMGDVYLAEQTSLRRQVALKVLQASRRLSPDAKGRFLREAALVARLNHPYVVPVYEAGETDGVLFYSMEHVEGESLDMYSQHHNLDLDSLLVLMIKVCEGVQAAHQRGILHRDLKPDNILVDAEAHPRILDFGLAKALQDESAEFTFATQQGHIVGTPAYMAPEQTLGDPDAVDTRTDVYALGVILYQLLTGRFPYDITGSVTMVMARIQREEPTAPRRHVPKLPIELQTVLFKTLAKDRESRYQSAGDLAADLQRFLDGRPVQAHPPSVTYRLAKWVNRHRSSALLTAIFSVLTIALALASVWRLNEARRIAEQNAREAQRQKQAAEDALEDATRARQEARAQAAKADARARMLALRLAADALTRRDAEAYDLLADLPDSWEKRVLWRAMRAVCPAPPARVLSHGGPVAFTPDNQALLIHGPREITRLNPDDPTESVTTFPHALSRQMDIDVSPDGVLTAVTAGSSVRLLWTAFGEEARRLQASGQVYHCRFSPDGSRIAADVWRRASNNQHAVVHIWSVNTGREIAAIEVGTNAIYDLVWLPDGTGFVNSAGTNTEIWNVEDARREAVIRTRHGGYAFAVSPDGTTLAMGAAGGMIRLFSCHDYQEVFSRRIDRSAVISIAFSPDGESLACGTDTGSVIICDDGGRSPGPTLHVPNRGKVGSVAFSPDGRRLAAGGGAWGDSMHNARAAVWDLELQSIPTIAGDAQRIAVSADGRHIITTTGGPGRAGRSVRVWDVTKTDTPVLAYDEAPSSVRAVAFDSVHRAAVVPAEPPEIVRIPLEAGGKPTTWLTQSTEGAKPEIRFSRDGKTVAVAGSTSVNVWDRYTGERLLDAVGHGFTVDLSPDSAWVAAAGRNQVTCWPLTGERVAHDLGSEELGNVQALRFAPDGSVLAVADAHGNVLLCAVPNWSVTRVLESDAGTVERLSFHPDSTRLAAATSAKRLLIWNLATDERLRIGDALAPDGAHDVAFSPTGTYLAVACADGTVKVLEASPFEPDRSRP